jgi:hypothetical protein
LGNLIIGYDLFDQEASGIKLRYPDLDKICRDDKSIIAGTLLLADSSHVLHDHYEIEIHGVPEYPFRFPRVFETGGRLPINVDWHVFETDGHCCFRTQPEELLACKKGVDLISFIEKEVKPYFFNQTFRNKFGYYLNERSHGTNGEIEFFFDLFRTKDLLQVYKHLKFVLGRQQPSRTQDCYCGSKEKYRRCHRDSFQNLAQLTDYELQYFINNLIHSGDFIKNYPLVAHQLILQGKS